MVSWIRTRNNDNPTSRNTKRVYVVLSISEKNDESKNIALQQLRTTCNTSEEANANTKCEKIMHGDVTLPWVTKILDNKQWIQLNFTDSYEVRRVDIYNRCRFGTQCELIDLIFSDGQVVKVSWQHYTQSVYHEIILTGCSNVASQNFWIYICILLCIMCVIKALTDKLSVFRITRLCNYFPNKNCTSVPVEMYYVDMIQTTSLRIACTKRCIMDSKWIGFDEILVWVWTTWRKVITQRGLEHTQARTQASTRTHAYTHTRARTHTHTRT